MIDAPFEALVTIVGAAGSGKSSVLRTRYERFRHEYPEARVLFGNAAETVAALAMEILCEGNDPPTIIDDVEAAALFVHSAQPLLALEWSAFAQNEIDPEVPGLRSPERFLESAYRLIRKLRDAAIDPEVFLARSLDGATAFYAKPPNFAHPDLLFATKETYRDSLDVTTAELQRQYRHEVDLAKILAHLYAQYVEVTASRSLLTERDAVVLARARLLADDTVRAQLRNRYAHAFLDDAQDLTLAQFELLQAIFGDSLGHVTLAGDAGSALSTFRGARPDKPLGAPAHRIELHEQHRVPPAIALHRARTQRDEAAFVAEQVAVRLRAGAAPGEIALLFRSVADVEVYETALLDRDIPTIVSGDVNVFTDRRALDALALLWNLWDPFRHDWLLRTLGNPALALSDASVAMLCAEPPDTQTPLFLLDEEPAPTSRSGRFDPKRDLRLGWNVMRGDQDAALSETARTRVVRFRALREGWLAALRTHTFESFVRRVWSEGLAREGPSDSARARAQDAVLRRLLARLCAFRERTPLATLGDILAYANERAETDFESCEDDGDERFVRILSIDAARGRAFDHVILPDVRAGSFPRWYVPDTFLFSPSLGMIPKENVGAARAARTAKFTYYMYRAKTREAYNAEERRAFTYALRRAKRDALVTASERATRGTTAPEFLEELRAAKIPGVVDARDSLR